MNSFFLTTLLYLFARYIHILSATLLVGGTLFYEMVVPVAIADLKDEQQLFIMARARWVFRGIVWTACAMSLVSGIISTHTHWRDYSSDQQYSFVHNPSDPGDIQVHRVHESPAGRPGWWWVAHASTGAIAIIIAVGLTMGTTPPSQPVGWMRINLVILMLVMFLASVTRQARLQMNTPAGRQIDSIETLPANTR